MAFRCIATPKTACYYQSIRCLSHLHSVMNIQIGIRMCTMAPAIRWLQMWWEALNKQAIRVCVVSTKPQLMNIAFYCRQFSSVSQISGLFELLCFDLLCRMKKLQQLFHCLHKKINIIVCRHRVTSLINEYETDQEKGGRKGEMASAARTNQLKFQNKTQESHNNNH